MRKIILASASPRRKEILSMMGIEFETMVLDCDENTDAENPWELVEKLSYIKSSTCAKKLENEADALVIGADTIVYCDGQILGKPRDKDDARMMLRMLSGNMHQVYTGVTVIDTANHNIATFHEKTDVFFTELSDDDIEDYIATLEPMDKAGSYGIQGKGLVFIEKIIGDYYNVVGLPACRLMKELRQIFRMDISPKRPGF